MFYKFNVNIWNKTPSTKVNGITIDGELEIVDTIDCDIQNYSKNLLLSQYGYDIEVSKRIFMDINSEIKIGTIIEYNSKNYEVRKFIEWDDYLEVFANGI